MTTVWRLIYGKVVGYFVDFARMSVDLLHFVELVAQANAVQSRQIGEQVLIGRVDESSVRAERKLRRVGERWIEAAFHGRVCG